VVSMAKFSVITVLETAPYPVFSRTLAWQERCDDSVEGERRAGITTARRAGFGRAEIAAGRRLIAFCPRWFYAPQAEEAALEKLPKRLRSCVTAVQRNHCPTGEEPAGV